MKSAMTLLAVLCTGLLVAESESREGLRNGDTVVFCGDSITCLGKFKPWGYRFQLTNALDKVRGWRDVKCVNLGFCGNGLRNWLDIERRSRTQCVQANDHARAYPAESVTSTFSNRVDVLVLSIGMNDMLCPFLADTPEQLVAWTNDYRTLVRTLRARLSPRRMVACTIQPLTNDPAGAKNRVEGILNDGICRIAAEEGITFADYHGALMRSLAAIRRRSTSYQDTPDFVHPLELGNIAMAAELTRALGNADIHDYLVKRFADRLGALVPVEKGGVAYRVFPRALEDVASQERAYDIEWVDAEKGAQGRETVRLVPEKAVNVVKVHGADVRIPAPWRVSEPMPKGASLADVKKWKTYCQTFDYLGGDDPWSVDYMQAWFGSKSETIFVVRRVWSEKARPVIFRLRTAAFSNTYSFTVYQDGLQVAANTLPRGETATRTWGVLSLKKGWNEIAVQCDHNQWQRQFSLEILPAAGDALDDLRFDATIVGKGEK